MVKWIVILLCALAIGAAGLDLRCGAVHPAADVVIVACRAGRLP